MTFQVTKMKIDLERAKQKLRGCEKSEERIKSKISPYMNDVNIVKNVLDNFINNIINQWENGLFEDLESANKVSEGLAQAHKAHQNYIDEQMNAFKIALENAGEIPDTKKTEKSHATQLELFRRVEKCFEKLMIKLPTILKACIEKNLKIRSDDIQKEEMIDFSRDFLYITIQELWFACNSFIDNLEPILPIRRKRKIDEHSRNGKSKFSVVFEYDSHKLRDSVSNVEVFCIKFAKSYDNAVMSLQSLFDKCFSDNITMIESNFKKGMSYLSLKQNLKSFISIFTQKKQSRSGSEPRFQQSDQQLEDIMEETLPLPTKKVF